MLHAPHQTSCALSQSGERLQLGKMEYCNFLDDKLLTANVDC